MIGLDADFYIAYELDTHPKHAFARPTLDGLIDSGETIGVCAQVIAEFLHVVTDANRFTSPLSMTEAVGRARQLFSAREIALLVPDMPTMNLCLEWIDEFQLGRKRILDTMLAATLVVNGISKLATMNDKDYRVFGKFEFISPPATPSP